jgi:hypothetical protein
MNRVPDTKVSDLRRRHALLRQQFDQRGAGVDAHKALANRRRQGVQDFGPIRAEFIPIQGRHSPYMLDALIFLIVRDQTRYGAPTELLLQRQAWGELDDNADGLSEIAMTDRLELIQHSNRFHVRWEPRPTR